MTRKSLSDLLKDELNPPAAESAQPDVTSPSNELQNQELLQQLTASSQEITRLQQREQELLQQLAAAIRQREEVEQDTLRLAQQNTQLLTENASLKAAAHPKPKTVTVLTTTNTPLNVNAPLNVNTPPPPRPRHIPPLPLQNSNDPPAWML